MGLTCSFEILKSLIKFLSQHRDKDDRSDARDVTAEVCTLPYFDEIMVTEPTSCEVKP